VKEVNSQQQWVLPGIVSGDHRSSRWGQITPHAGIVSHINAGGANDLNDEEGKYRYREGECYNGL
jgi:hypothetical protein